MIVNIDGLGALGQRHLEGVISAAKSRPGEVSVHVSDPMMDERECCLLGQKVADDLDFKGPILPKENYADLVINATNIHGRLNGAKINAAVTILEKPIANNEKELSDIQKVVQDKSGKYFVNYSRRMWNIYRQILEKIHSDESLLKISVECNRIGLLSNGLHYIDLFDWMSADFPYNEDSMDIDFYQIFDSKRKGFKEASGKITCSRGNFRFQLEDLFSEEAKPKSVVTIFAKNIVYRLDELSGVVSLLDRDGQIVQESNFKPEDNFQSTLTKQIVTNILDGGEILLPSFDNILSSTKTYITSYRKQFGLIQFT